MSMMLAESITGVPVPWRMAHEGAGRVGEGPEDVPSGEHAALPLGEYYTAPQAVLTMEDGP